MPAAVPVSPSLMSSRGVGLQESVFKLYMDEQLSEMRSMIRTVHEETVRQAHMNEVWRGMPG